MDKDKKNKDNLNEKRRRESSKKILGAAFKVFVDHGYAGASMSQIAKLAAVPQALIYHYFKSKEDLWKAVKKDIFHSASMSPDFGAKGAKTLQEFVEIALKNRLAFYEENPLLWRIIKWESLEGDSANILGLSGNFEGPWADELKALKDNGKIKKDVDIKLLGILVRSAFFGLLDDMPKLYHSGLREKQRQYIDLVAVALSKAFSDAS